MVVLKQRTWSSDLRQRFSTQFNQMLQSWGVNSDVQTAIKKICFELIDDYAILDCHLIGKWDYDEETEEYTNEGVSQLFHYIISKYKPYILVFNSEYAKLAEQLTRTHSGSNSGNSKSASESSPITAASITSAPSGASDWGLDSPSMKSGSQYNQTHSNTESIIDPLVQKRILEFNVGELNLTMIGRRIIQSLTEEYNTVY